MIRQLIQVLMGLPAQGLETPVLTPAEVLDQLKNSRASANARTHKPYLSTVVPGNPS